MQFGPFFYNKCKARQDKMFILTLVLYFASKSCKFRSPKWQLNNNWRASCKKGVYRILADSHFLQERANFFSWHRFETRLADFFLSVSLLISKTKTFIWRKQAVKAAKSKSSRQNLASKDSLVKMPLRTKLSLFAYVISGEQSANRPKQLRNDAFHVKTSQSAKH